MFITFEGPEGSGKSSQIRLLGAFLQSLGYVVRLTREPGGTPIGDEIRACVHNVHNMHMCPEAELLLYSASRAQLVWEVIRPSLAAGQMVLCDRYSDSTLAYQGYGRGLELNALRQITNFATGGLKPDLTFLLDIDVEVGLSRRSDGGMEMNRLDLETVAFHQRVRQGYHHLASLEPSRWVIIDADDAVEAVQEKLRAVISAHL